jgi:hypothetical protein
MERKLPKGVEPGDLERGGVQGAVALGKMRTGEAAVVAYRDGQWWHCLGQSGGGAGLGQGDSGTVGGASTRTTVALGLGHVGGSAAPGPWKG